MLLVIAIFPASELLTDTVILDLVDDVIDRHEGLITVVTFTLRIADTGST